MSSKAIETIVCFFLHDRTGTRCRLTSLMIPTIVVLLRSFLCSCIQSPNLAMKLTAERERETNWAIDQHIPLTLMLRFSGSTSSSSNEIDSFDWKSSRLGWAGSLYNTQTLLCNSEQWVSLFDDLLVRIVGRVSGVRRVLSRSDWFRFQFESLN